MISTGRQHDLQELFKEYKTASPARKIVLSKIIHKLQHESKDVTSMRSSLIRAHRSGNIDEIKDIHDYTEGKHKYG